MKGWAGGAILMLALFIGVWGAAAQRSDDAVFDFEDGYSISIPAGYESANPQAGVLQMRNTRLMITALSPGLMNELLNGVTDEPSEAVAVSIEALTGTGIDAADIVQTEIDGRLVAYADFEFMQNGQTSSARFYIVTMSDGALAGVYANAVEGSVDAFGAEIETLIATFNGEQIAATPEPDGLTFELYALSDEYAVTLPNFFEITADEPGVVVAQNDDFQIVYYDPSVVSDAIDYDDATDPLVIFDAAFTALTLTTAELEAVVAGEAFGRGLYTLDSSLSADRNPIQARFSLVEMSDQRYGVVIVYQAGEQFTLTETAFESLIEIYDTTARVQALLEENQPAAQTETADSTPAETVPPTLTPTRTATPTVTPTATMTPTPIPLSPQSGTYTLVFTPSDGEATCEIGFVPLGDVLGALSHVGEVTPDEDGLTFTGEEGISARLDASGELNAYTGIFENDGVYTVELRLTQTAMDAYVGEVTSSYVIIGEDGEFTCVDRSTVTLDAAS
jgi:hypothetical protein